MADLTPYGGSNNLQTLNGLFKEVYGDRLEDLIPDGVKLLNKIPFAKKDSQLGNKYHQPVILGQEHGVTFAGAGDDAFTLLAPVAGTIKDATIQGTQMVLRSVLGYASAARSAQGGAKAFEQATKFLVANMLRSITKKLEIEMLYGQVGWGTVASDAEAGTRPEAPGFAVVGNDMYLAIAEWAPGIWAGSEQMPIDIYTSAGALRGSAVITAVDFENLKLSVDSMPAAVAPTDVIYHKGAFGHEFAGIHKIITNTSTIFGIDASQYALWKGNEFDAGGAALSFNKLQDAIAKGVEKGLDSDVMVVVNPSTWADLLNDQAALRQYDSSYSSSVAENGSREISFHAQSGKVEIVPSIYCKEGYAYVLDQSCFARIGSTDVTFKRPGRGDEFFRELDSAAGYELRSYTDQAVFCHSPGRNVLIKNIVN
jgi:hypothetical protein